MCAVALATSWGGYLRGSEVLSLKWKDIALPGDIRLNQSTSPLAGVNVPMSTYKTSPFLFTPRGSEGHCMTIVTRCRHILFVSPVDGRLSRRCSTI